MKRTELLLIISAVLVFAILAFTFFGCTCKRKIFSEGFETAATPAAPPTAAPSAAKDDAEEDDSTTKPLTPKEKELFEDLKNNRLSEDEIKTLVQNNILNEQLVEKFLDKLVPEDGDNNVVEGFTSVGNSFACASFGAE